jgi:hypothetical protein
VICRDLAQAAAQLGLLKGDHLAAMALGTAVLAHHPAGGPLRCPEPSAQGLHGPAAAFLAQKFPSANSHCFAEACS